MGVSNQEVDREQSGDITNDKVISLYKCIEELNALKQKFVLNVSEYPWTCYLCGVPFDPKNIEIFNRDRVEDESSDENTALLSVHKPEYQKCPEPDEILKGWLQEGWLQEGWDSFCAPAKLRGSITRDKTGREYRPKQPGEEQFSIFGTINTEKEEEAEEETTTELFTDNASRVKAYEKWVELRSAWAERQKVIQKTRDFFAKLYKIHIDLERETESLELVVADGFIKDRDKSEINHPVLTRRLKTRYEAKANTIFFEDTDVETEIYSKIFQIMTDVNSNSIKSLEENLRANDYHPMDRNDTPQFLKILIHQLSAESLFSAYGEPEDWRLSNRILLYSSPAFILRKRVDGTLRAIELIIENIERNGDVPGPIIEIVSGGRKDIPETDGEESIEEQLAAVGGESVDILLAKEANREQLEIAKRIEQYNAVIVQGPPGTGKTHTIANLMGHFLAQGKSVLVTSHTPKALSVLKEQIDPGLQNLCVSVLADSNVDMEKSVDGITDYMSKTTSFEVKRKMDKLAGKRRGIIDELAGTRKKIYAIINRECNSIVLNGEEFIPLDAAAFVLEHVEDLSYIPGQVKLYSPLPLSFKELNELYRSNEKIAAEDEPELACELPAPATTLSPDAYTTALETLKKHIEFIGTYATDNGWKIRNSTEAMRVDFETGDCDFSVEYPEEAALDSLKDYTSSFGNIEAWMKFAVVDGKKGGAFKQRWTSLIEQIEKTCEYAESVIPERFGKEIVLSSDDDLGKFIPTLEKIKSAFVKKGRLSKWDLLTNKAFSEALKVATIDGTQIKSAEDCDIILHSIELDAIRKQCAVYWDDLLAPNDVPKFFSLDETEPERVAQNWIQPIRRYLNWYRQDYVLLSERLAAANIPTDIVFAANVLDTGIVATNRILSAVDNVIPTVISALYSAIKIRECNEVIANTRYSLQIGIRSKSKVCANLIRAIDAESSEAYENSFYVLDTLYSKYDLQNKRNEMLRIIEPIAPQWANAIRNREGIHGGNAMPNSIEDAWKWKQLSGIISEITAEPFEKLQAKSLSLSKEYRKLTAKYAENSAWFHLLRETESDVDIKQALQGWKQTVKKIGKGTSKNAPMHKAKARELMAKCQTAVPGWIMPIGRALESLDPRTNRFDVIIIDEASQADVSALAILYMGKKLIIVGDDKQVSPMAVGVEADKMRAIMEMHIKDKIPNYHLYDLKTSIYDIAATTFQPLMLREHFRCVPEIIGFSNQLSYDYKIKPLRDSGSSNLLPAVVNYRVADGKREGHSNVKEAMTIVSLIKACMAQPEYDGKTFGVISMLSDGEQVKKIQSLIDLHIDNKESAQRRILCGNAPNFQGDQRDVIFLSLVDSNLGAGTLKTKNFGQNEIYRKHYNVAASRARDQLWVVDSLDAANDLNPGDIRRRLIKYSINPASMDNLYAEIEEKAESPFEIAVAKALVDRGYHLEQQWKVGSYRLDMVAVFGKKTVAIECDGERWHSGEEKIRADMERQTILERIGWKFIRIRGSEYYRDPDKTIERVVSRLTEYGIEAESQADSVNESRTSELLQRVKAKAAQILSGNFGKNSHNTIDMDTIAAALSNNETVKTEGEPPIETCPLLDSKGKTPIVENSETIIAKLEKPPMSEKPMRYTERQHAASGDHTGLRFNNSATENTRKTGGNIAKQKKTEQNPKTKKADKTKKKNVGDELTAELTQLGYEFVDNRSQSNILWIIYSQGNKEAVEVLMKKYDYQYKLEKRGAISTGNRAAWCVMI